MCVWRGVGGGGVFVCGYGCVGMCVDLFILLLPYR